MNRILLLTCLLLCLIGCDQLKKKKKSKIDAFENKVEQELSKSIRNDTIFLGFTFGMSEREFRAKAKQLMNQGILYEGKRSQITYDLIIGENSTDTYTCTFDPEYHEGKLYYLRVNATPNGVLSGLEPNKYQIFLVAFFREKYGMAYQSEFIEGEDKYNWIKGNCMIEIFPGYNHVAIEYVDYPIQLKVDSLERLEDVKNVESSKKAI